MLRISTLGTEPRMQSKGLGFKDLGRDWHTLERGEMRSVSLNLRPKTELALLLLWAGDGGARKHRVCGAF